MTRRYLSLVVLSAGAACLVWLGLNGSPAKGAEAQMRPAMLDSTIKVGIVDLNRAFKESKSVSAAKAELIQDRKNKLQILKARREEIKELGKEIQNQRALLSEVVRRQKEGELDRSCGHWNGSETTPNRSSTAGTSPSIDFFSPTPRR